MKALIVTADGFGLTAALSRRIVDAHTDGIVTSASMVVNTPHLSHALRLARERPHLAIGLQLNLTHGHAVSQPGTVPSLVDCEGNFHGQAAGWSPADVHTEVHAQLEIYRRTGLALTHINTLQGIDRHDAVLRELLQIAQLGGVRCRTERREDLRRAGVAGVDWLIGDAGLRLSDGKVCLFQHVTSLRKGVTELVCSAPCADGGQPTPAGTGNAEASALRLMTSRFIRRCIRYAGVQLVSFTDLQAPKQVEATAETAPAAGPRPPYDAGFDAGFDEGYNRGFDAGYEMGSSIAMQPRWELFGDSPLAVAELAGKRAVAVVPVRNEARRLDILLHQLKRLPLDDVVVVANGSTDGSAEIARERGCSVVTFPAAVGHDVARAIGVAGREADVWLFTDADMPFEAEQFVPFLAAAAAGVDVALNDISPFVTVEGRTHVVNIAKEFLNRALGRPDLATNSMTAVPHALSTRALRVIGTPRLAVPPLAHAVAITEGLRVEAVHSVDVISHNRVRSAPSADRGLRTIEQLILGDHIEAIHYVTDHFGRRGGLTDASRRRDTIAEAMQATLSTQAALPAPPAGETPQTQNTQPAPGTLPEPTAGDARQTQAMRPTCGTQPASPTEAPRATAGRSGPAQETPPREIPRTVPVLPPAPEAQATPAAGEIQGEPKTPPRSRPAEQAIQTAASTADLQATAEIQPSQPAPHAPAPQTGQAQALQTNQ